MDIDSAGFETWYRAEHPRVLAALAVVARDPDVAQEAAAEAFARALQRWDRVGAMDSPGGWTYRVALNVLRRRARRAALERRLLLRLAPPATSGGWLRCSLPTPSPKRSPMADPHPKLSVLVDPPLAEPPPVAELHRRASALRRRRVAGRGLLAAAVVAVLIGSGLALLPEDPPQAVETAAAPSSTAPAGAATGPLPATVAIKTFEVDCQEWNMLATRTDDPAICITLQPAAGEEIRPGCLTPDGRALQAAAADLRSVSFLYGIVAPDVNAVTLTAGGNASALDVVGAGAGFPVRFVGTVVAPSVTAAELTASRNGAEERVAVPLPAHLRVSAGRGRDAPPAPPSTGATAPRPTLAPDTPVSTVAPPPAPSTTIAPGLGQPKRVQPVPGATDLHKQAFQSAAPAGAQSLAVRFWNGVEPCYVLGRVDVTETAEKVTITLWTGTGPGAAGMACIQMAGYYEVIVPLQAPLGDRTVVDGAA